jgi:hypothetical protein
MVRRVVVGWMAAFAVLAVSLCVQQPAAAAGYDTRATMRSYQLIPYTGVSINATFYTPKVDFGDWSTVKVDLSGLDRRVSVKPIGGGCEATDAQHFRCVAGRTGDDETTTIGFTVGAPADMPAGPAGTLSVWVDGGATDPNPANNTARSTLDITNKAGSRVELNTKTVTAKIGQTVTVPVTGRNRGPNAIWALAVGNVDIPAGDLIFTGYTGCAGAWTDNYCASGYVRAGGSTTIGLKLKIKRCSPGHAFVPVVYRDGFTSREITLQWRFTVTIAVAGCTTTAPPAAASNTGGAPTTTAAAPAASATTATASPSPSPTDNTSATPATSPSTDSHGIALAGATPNEPSKTPWIVAALIISFIAAAIALSLQRRRKAAGASAPAE